MHLSLFAISGIDTYFQRSRTEDPTFKARLSMKATRGGAAITAIILYLRNGVQSSEIRDVTKPGRVRFTAALRKRENEGKAGAYSHICVRMRARASPRVSRSLGFSKSYLLSVCKTRTHHRFSKRISLLIHPFRCLVIIEEDAVHKQRQFLCISIGREL